MLFAWPELRKRVFLPAFCNETSTRYSGGLLASHFCLAFMCVALMPVSIFSQWQEQNSKFSPCRIPLEECLGPQYASLSLIIELYIRFDLAVRH